MTSETAKKICALNIQTYNRIARAFSDTRTRPWDDLTPLTTYLSDGMSILDIGCGNGRILTALPQDISFHYTGVDISAALIQEAERIHEHDIRKPQFFIGDVLSLQDVPDLQGKQFDIVSAVAVLNHIPDRALQIQALSNVRLFLKPGGLLFLTNWNLLQIQARKSVWRYTLERYRTPDSVWQKKYGFSKKELSFRDCLTTWKSGALAEPLYYYSFTLHELTRLCRAASLRMQDTYYSKHGKHAHWWSGRNTVAVARLLDSKT